MAVRGDDGQRLDQSGGLDPDSGALVTAPVLIISSDNEEVNRLHVLMQGRRAGDKGEDIQSIS